MLSVSDRYFFQTYFQNSIQVSLQLSKKPCPQQIPYENKYLAIKKLNSLLDKCKQITSINYNYNFIVYCVLGELYSDVQQTGDSIKCYKHALISLSMLPIKQINKFYQYFIVAYNMLGLSLINIQQTEQGIGCLCKSYQIYQSFLQNTGNNYYHNRSYKSNGKLFNFYYQGGNDHSQIQDNHTLTLFYLAQAYTKIGLKDKAAEYCGITLQRQWAGKKFQVTQFCNNLIGLSQYYSGHKYYAQAEYILLLALKVLPEGKKKKMRALIQIQLAKILADMLAYSCQRIRQNNPIQKFQNDIVNKQVLLFDGFDQKFPQVNMAVDLQGCKSLFRKSNTQLKKASQVFVLDGFVTEHLQILHQQSALYKSLCVIQLSKQRVYSMLQKRRQLLQPLLKQLNPKAYPASWQRILVQVSQIYHDLFTIKSMIILQPTNKSVPTQNKLQQMNKIGLQSIQYYKQIIKCLQQDKQTQRSQQYFRSLINSKFNIAKTQSKLLSLDKFIRVKYLKSSYDHYKQLYTYIEKSIDQNLVHLYKQEMELTNDMIIMMPNKIDKINYAMMSPLE